MREIKFRAKLKEWKNNSECNKWINGYYLSRAETTYCFKEDYEKFPVKILHYIAQERMTDWGLPNDFRLYEIDESTACQYTGLKDKNGKEIYEGDIIKHLFREDTAVIKFGKYHNVFDSQESYHYGFYVDWQTKNTKNTRKDLGYWIEMLDESNIIGNIFDNPELLDADKQASKYADNDVMNPAT